MPCCLDESLSLFKFRALQDQELGPLSKSRVSKILTYTAMSLSGSLCRAL